MAFLTSRLALLSLAALLGGVGCVAGQSFVPAEHVTALSPGGDHYAAEYRMQDRQGVLGDAKVWSNGVYRSDADGQARTVVHVGFVFENAIDTPVRLDTSQLYLDDVSLDDGSIDRVDPLRITGDPVIVAGGDAKIEVLFALPGVVWPSSVLAYRVVWTIANGGRYTERTPFLQASAYGDGPYGPPIYGYYSPYYTPWPYGYYRYPSLRVERRYYPSWPYVRRR